MSCLLPLICLVWVWIPNHAVHATLSLLEGFILIPLFLPSHHWGDTLLLAGWGDMPLSVHTTINTAFFDHRDVLKNMNFKRHHSYTSRFRSVGATRFIIFDSFDLTFILILTWQQLYYTCVSREIHCSKPNAPLSACDASAHGQTVVAYGTLHPVIVQQARLTVKVQWLCVIYVLIIN